MESNHHSWIQSPLSCHWTTPERGAEIAAEALHVETCAHAGRGDFHFHPPQNILTSRPLGVGAISGSLDVTASLLRPGLLFASTLVGLAAASATLAPAAEAQRVIDIEYTPTRRAQIAVWITRADGSYLRTLSLTQSVSLYGIGNRPGAMQMNSGFRWPYGRREGVLPVWAHARVAGGNEPFRRVIFQDRTSEGYASRSSSDFSRDDHFCLSFSNATTQRDALDAVSCASVFNSDKGRYVTDADVAASYVEPAEARGGVSAPYALGLDSLYPARRDTRRCAEAGCYDHEDLARFADDARAVMPEIDAVTAATPAEAVTQRLMFTVPDDWTSGRYDVYVEVNVEGDYAPGWSDTEYPTPRSPAGGAPQTQWDYWAMSYGYPYRGQPSVVYRVPVQIGQTDVSGVTDPIGYGSIDGRGPAGGAIQPMDPSIVDDPTGAPGSGADRLHTQAGHGYRVRVRSQAAEACRLNTPPSAIEGLEVSQYHERRDAHRFAHLSMIAPSDDQGVVLYEVRYSDQPITDESSFLRARPASAARLEIEALQVPLDVPAGQPIDVDIGGLTFESHYWVAVRAIDACNATSPIAITEYTTPAIEFTTVSPCFVATAAYATPMAEEIGALRRLRDRHLRTNPLGSALVDAYYAVGPELAELIAEDDDRRAVARALLSPVVSLARWLDD